MRSRRLRPAAPARRRADGVADDLDPAIAEDRYAPDALVAAGLASVLAIAASTTVRALRQANLGTYDGLQDHLDAVERGLGRALQHLGFDAIRFDRSIAGTGLMIVTELVAIVVLIAFTLRRSEQRHIARRGGMGERRVAARSAKPDRR